MLYDFIIVSHLKQFLTDKVGYKFNKYRFRFIYGVTHMDLVGPKLTDFKKKLYEFLISEILVLPSSRRHRQL